MEIRQLKYFLTLCEYRNYTRAAKELFITQPTLSQQISALESNLGISLIDHSGKSFKLTNGGEAFREMAEKFMEKYRNFMDDVNNIKQSQNHLLHYASLNALNSIYTPDLFSNFIKAHPNVTITHSTTVFYNLVTFVQEKLVDISMAMLYSDKKYEGLEKIMLHRHDDILVIVIPNNSPYSQIASFEDPRMKELLSRTCYLYDGWRDYEIPLRIIQKHIERPARTIYYDNLIEFLSHPYSWEADYTIIPQKHLQHIQGTPFFRTIPFPDNLCRLDCALLYRSDNKNPAARMFLEELLQPEQIFEKELEKHP